MIIGLVLIESPDRLFSLYNFEDRVVVNEFVQPYQPPRLRTDSERQETMKMHISQHLIHSTPVNRNVTRAPCITGGITGSGARWHHCRPNGFRTQDLLRKPAPMACPSRMHSPNLPINLRSTQSSGGVGMHVCPRCSWDGTFSGRIGSHR